MPTQTLAMTTLVYYRARQTHQKGAWDKLPDGSDGLHRLHGLFANSSRSDLTRPGKGEYVEVKRVEPQGRTLLVTLRMGRNGVPGEVMDDNGARVSEYPSSHTHTVDTQLLFVLPKGGTTALMFSDSIWGRSARTAALQLIRARWIDTFSTHTFAPTTVNFGEAWLQTAQVEGITAYVNSFSHDLADVAATGGSRKVVGRIKHELTPPRGVRTLVGGKQLVKQLRDGTARGALLGLDDEPDSVKVKLGDGDRQRTFEIGQDATPGYQAVLAEDGEPVKSGSDFIDECVRECKDGASALTSAMFTWKDSYRTGVWSDAELQVRWDRV